MTVAKSRNRREPMFSPQPPPPLSPSPRKINGRSRRNVYYAGLGRLACGDRRGAKDLFARAVSDEHCESVTLTEKDIAASIREQAQRGLDVCG